MKLDFITPSMRGLQLHKPPSNNRKYSRVHGKSKTCWFGNYSKNLETFVHASTPLHIYLLFKLKTNKQTNPTLSTFWVQHGMVLQLFLSTHTVVSKYFKWHASLTMDTLVLHFCACQDRLVVGSPISLIHKGLVIRTTVQNNQFTSLSVTLERGTMRGSYFRSHSERNTIGEGGTSLLE